MLPQFSIALPVYNGGSFLKLCIESILNQTYKNFKLLIFNSANNTDGSTEFIKSISDERVQIFQATEPLTIVQNWSRFISELNTEFATIIGQDDVYGPNFLETMYELIREHPNASLWHSHFDFIDKDGKRIRVCESLPLKESAEKYIENILLFKTDSIGTGYIFRSKDYQSVNGIPNFPSLLFADLALWIQLTHISHKINSNKYLFSFRIHDSTTSLSSATTYFDSFILFIRFLKSFGNLEPEYDDIVKTNLERYLAFCAQIIAFKIIRSSVPASQIGQRFTVTEVLNSINQMAKEEKWLPHPGNVKFTFKTKIVSVISSSIFLLKIYHTFRRFKANS